jgi:hypothetical protein
MSAFKTTLSTATELVSFLWAERLWWVIPIVVMLLVLGGVIVLAQSSAIAPFIYTLF